jgi:DNA-binding NarL/FixJ family response regulator
LSMISRYFMAVFIPTTQPRASHTSRKRARASFTPFTRNFTAVYQSTPHFEAKRCSNGMRPRTVTLMENDMSLTARERDVLTMMSQGFANKHIARILVISPETVKSHIKHIFSKLAASTRTEAVFRAGSLGLLW